MIAWIIWQHDMIDHHSQIIDSIHTNETVAKARKKKIEMDNVYNERVSAPFMAEIQLDMVIDLDLDITLKRDGKGIPIEHSV